MYSRPPNNLRRKITVPENYGGNAFKLDVGDPSSASYSDMPPALHLDRSYSDLQTSKSNEDETAIENEQKSSVSSNSDEIAPSLPTVPTHSQNVTESAKSSVFSSFFPSNIASSSHFPFGHGIGSEELLIMAMMMLTYLSGEENDNEFLFLLGLLLFAG